MPSAASRRRRRYSEVFNRNLVTFDPGFETGLISPDGGIGTGGGTWSTDTTFPRNGSFCARYNPLGQTSEALLVANGSQGNSTLQPAAVKGETFYFEVWTRAELPLPSNNVNVEMRFADAAGASILISEGPFLQPSTTYQKISHTATAPAGTVLVAFRIHVVADLNDNDLFFDDRLAQRVVG